MEVDALKSRALRRLLNKFAEAGFIRFAEIEGNIEDIWDIAANQETLYARLQTIASKDFEDLSIKNMIDISLIGAFLWNNTEDPAPEPLPEPEPPEEDPV